MSYDPACVFCKIVRNELPSHRVFEDDHVVAFLDRHPFVRGHLVVAPRDHYPTVYEAPPPVVARTAEVLPRLVAAVRDAMGSDGAMVVMNAGPPGQLVFHLHWHIVPRSHGDEFSRRGFGARAPDPNPSETAEAIRRSL